MKVFLEKEGKTINVKFNGKVCMLLKKLKINPETVLIVRNDELITEKDSISGKDNIKLISVISCG
jgi:sulfur carrier protein ThiS